MANFLTPTELLKALKKDEREGEGVSPPHHQPLPVPANFPNGRERGATGTGAPPSLLQPSLTSPLSYTGANGGTSGTSSSSISSATNTTNTNTNTTINTTATLHTPYRSDIEYAEDAFKALAYMIRARNSEGDIKDEDEAPSPSGKTQTEAQLRELLGRQRVAFSRLKSRVEATRKAGPWLPRLERLSSRLGLTEFEKQILLLLVGNSVSHDILVAINGRCVMRDGQRELTVGYLLFVLCENLRQRVECRRAFSLSSPLLANGLVSVTVSQAFGKHKYNTDVMDYYVDIDRSIVDYLIGVDARTEELVDGSRLYDPKVPIANVVLPEETKERVSSTISHYAMYTRCKRRCGFGEGLGAADAGLVFLFYGPSGTGKTMLANAVACDLGRKLLLVNLQQFSSDPRSSEMLRFIFREAKLNEAIIFFDECEGFFAAREANSRVTAVLSEFERYDGMIILATNKAQVIDEAMNRRISLMVEFKLPDHQMRERIWEMHLPRQLPLAPDVSLQDLAMEYELTGGLIRNAVLSAISAAIGREKCESPTLRMSDLRLGAKAQLRGLFQTSALKAKEYVVPKRSLGELVMDKAAKDAVVDVAKLSKSRNTLFAQWGFAEEEYADQSVICLFHGPSGTGKSLAVEGIAYECGATIRLCNVSEMLTSGAIEVSTVFDEAKALGAVVAFDQAQELFNFSEASARLSRLISYHAAQYNRPVIVVATTGTEKTFSIDPRGSPIIFTTEIAFHLPSKALRVELWRRALPDKVPLAPDVNFDLLSQRPLSGKTIRQICFSASCKAALNPQSKQLVTMAAITAETEEILTREKARGFYRNMFL